MQARLRPPRRAARSTSCSALAAPLKVTLSCCMPGTNGTQRQGICRWAEVYLQFRACAFKGQVLGYMLQA